MPTDLLPPHLATDTALTILVEGSVLLGATWIVAALLRQHAPSVRHTVWTAGFALALLVPLGGAILPVRSLGLVPYPTSEAAAASPANTAGRAPTVPGLLRGLPGRSPDLRSSSAAPGGLDPTPAGSGLRGLGAGMANAFLLVWGLGALVLLARLVGHRVQIARLTARGSPAAPADRSAHLALAEAARMGIRRPVGVVHTSELALPVTWGVLRPVLLLPDDAASWPEARLRAVVVHELAHVRRWDALSQLIAELVRALYWANPLAWLGRRGAARERERACDYEVLRHGMPPSTYAAVLLQMAQRSAPGRGARRTDLGGGLAMAGPSRLEARVSAILEGPPDRRRPGGGRALASCLALTLVGASLATVTLAGEAPSAAVDARSVAARLDEVRALEGACDEGALEILASALEGDAAPVVRTGAARMLATHDNPRAADVLADAAADDGEDPAVRRAALHALGQRGTRRAARALVHRLHDEDPHIRRTAVRAMEGMPGQANRLVEPLARTMRHDPDPTVRAAAASALETVECGRAGHRRHGHGDRSPLLRHGYPGPMDGFDQA